MRMRLPQYYYFLLLLLLVIVSPLLVNAGPLDYPTAKLSTVWTNNISTRKAIIYSDGTMIRPILLRGSSGPSFICGFFCIAAPACHTYRFAVAIFYNDSDLVFTDPMSAMPQVIWSANRGHLIEENATLHFSSDGNLVLEDANGRTVWSTDTAGKSVAGMSLTENGSLILFDEGNATVWDSFDYPTDSLILGQTLREGQRLVANGSAANSTEGQLYLTTTSGGLEAYVDANPPQIYYSYVAYDPKPQNKSSYITFSNGNLSIFTSLVQGQPTFTILLPQVSTMQYMRFESNGHLRLYEWGIMDSGAFGWKRVADVLAVQLNDDCDYPTVCGEYGFCSTGQCSCLSPAYFKPVNERQLNLGCSLATPLSCQSIKHHRLLHLDDVAYFSYQIEAASISTDEESCKQACLRNCSCKAAFFKYYSNISEGACYLPSKIFSMKNNNQNESGYYSTAYIKVQDPVGVPNSLPPAPSRSNWLDSLSKKTISVGVVVGVTVPFAVGFIIVLVRRRNIGEFEEEDDLENLAGLPTRFSFEEMKVATKDFCLKLGGGGFGSVFEGKLSVGMRIAVKRLDHIGQGKKEFLAEVNTIGSIHHINLVQLIGFCSEKSCRLLVYEYMCNGSLDRWIFHRNQDLALDWKTRFQIITDIAKGLSYLHEECRQRIAHLDIKPQNILLDEEFRAKVADFGLSKLIDREQSHVLTTIRGTRGYLAPEWLTSKITEKADVFSFGIVIMEIMCGRKNLDYSLPEECVHLVSLLQNKVKESRLMDIADKSKDMQLHENEIIEMMRLAMWCLQTDSTRRPKMSTVVKVLEGSINVETNIEYDFTTLTLQDRANGENFAPSSGPRSTWFLSGPR